MALANVALTDTFDTWRVRTNQLIVLYDQSNNQISSAFANVPAAFGHANSAFDKANAANVLAFNALPKTGGTVTGDLTVSGNVIFSSNLTLSSGLVINGSNTFSITGNLVTVRSNVSLSNNIIITGSTFSVTGNDVLFSTNVSFSGSSTFDNDVTFNDASVFNNNVTFNDASFSGNATFNNNVTLSKGVYANGSFGSSGQVLTSNGSGVYWSTVTSGGGSSINLSINNTDPSTYYFPMSNTSNGTWSNGVISNTSLYFVPSTGTLSATVFNSLSDIEFKTNIVALEHALDIVTKLRGVKFNWKDDNRPSIGVIAQEIEKVLPELVTTHDLKKSVNYDGLIGVLIQAINELKTEIDNLKN